MSKPTENQRTPSPEGSSPSSPPRPAVHAATPPDGTRGDAAKAGDNRAAAPGTGSASTSCRAVVPAHSSHDTSKEKTANEEKGKVGTSRPSGPPVGSSPSWRNLHPVSGVGAGILDRGSPARGRHDYGPGRHRLRDRETRQDCGAVPRRPPLTRTCMHTFSGSPAAVRRGLASYGGYTSILAQGKMNVARACPENSSL
ncbi:hypothetical protein MTO96_020480 [Rhipicephalus appendiculatus]